MVRLMCGRQITRGSLHSGGETARPRCCASNISTCIDPARPGGFRLRDVSFTVRRGEIVGLAGLVGAGRTDLLLALVGGLDRAVDRTNPCSTAGSTCRRSPAAARDAGMVMLPEERKASGIFPHLGVDRNITISALGRVSPLGLDRPARRTREPPSG